MRTDSEEGVIVICSMVRVAPITEEEVKGELLIFTLALIIICQIKTVVLLTLLPKPITTLAPISRIYPSQKRFRMHQS